MYFFFPEFTREAESKIMLTFGYYFRMCVMRSVESVYVLVCLSV